MAVFGLNAEWRNGYLGGMSRAGNLRKILKETADLFCRHNVIGGSPG